MKLIRVLLLAVAMFGVATSAVGGTNNAFTFYPSDTAPVTALSNPVTYSTPASGKIPAMQTYVGFAVGNTSPGGLLLSNSSGNTVNDVTITFTASVTDTAELLTFHLPEVYIPAGCTWDNVPSNIKTVSCNIRQLKKDGNFPAFTVFFVAPQKVCQATTAPTNACGGLGDAPGSDTISTKVTVVYAEGLNGPNPVEPNSNLERPQPNLVVLGTDNPVNIKSAVPKSGAKVFTGNGGVPVPDTPDTPDRQFAELLTVPALSTAYTVAEISVTKVKDTDPIEGADCLNGGRFKACPTFATSVANNGVETRFLDLANPLTFTYRIDASNIKMSPSKLLNSVSIKYTGKQYDPITNAEVGIWSDTEIPKVCVNNQPSKDGLPCVLNSRCYKKNDTGGIADLESDCEWTTVNTGNGLIKIQ